VKALRPGPVGALLAVALLLVQVGCANAPTPASPAPAVRTASDETQADRRAKVRLELAAAYFARGQNTTALDEVKLALAARPDLAEAYSLQGLVYAAMGENRLAEDSFQRALQLNPRDADAMHNFGFFLCQQRRFPAAEAQFKAALAVPQFSGAARTTLALGICQARNGQWLDAERSLSRSYELDPGSAVTAYNLSEVLLQRAELVRARFYIQRVNAVPEQVNAQSLWLAARIERRLGDQAALQGLARQLRDRFPQSPEALQLERGRFDD
jgi:type IV pilus assembly protein PilF